MAVRALTPHLSINQNADPRPSLMKTKDCEDGTLNHEREVVWVVDDTIVFYS